MTNTLKTLGAFEIAGIGVDHKYFANKKFFSVMENDKGTGASLGTLNDLEKRLAEAPVITVPTITMEGDANSAPRAESSGYAKKFSGKYVHPTINGGISGQSAAMILAVLAPQSKPARIARLIFSTSISAVISTAIADGCPFRIVPFEASFTQNR